MALPRLGNYDLLRTLGKGGMATVVLAQRRSPMARVFPRPKVAIKRLHAELLDDNELQAMLADEARIIAHIRHPNVVSLVEVIPDGRGLAIVMDWIDGIDLGVILAELREKKQPMPASVAVSIVIDMLCGLQAAHEARDRNDGALNVVHRDVSPQNVIVGADGSARVSDFGIAKALGRARTTVNGAIRGKIAYAAPEQLSGERVTPGADVYGAGVTLWECLAGRRLFTGRTEEELIVKVVSGNVSPPSRYSGEVTAALDDIVLRAIAREPELRYASAGELLAALLPFGFANARARAAHVRSWLATTHLAPARPPSSRRFAWGVAIVAASVGTVGVGAARFASPRRANDNVNAEAVGAVSSDAPPDGPAQGADRDDASAPRPPLDASAAASFIAPDAALSVPGTPAVVAEARTGMPHAPSTANVPSTKNACGAGFDLDDAGRKIFRAECFR